MGDLAQLAKVFVQRVSRDPQTIETDKNTLIVIKFCSFSVW